MPGPSSCRTAGRTVTEPTTAHATTAMVPLAIPLKTLDRITNWAAMATITVVPAITTDRPEVRAVYSSASCEDKPRRRSSRERTT